MPGKYDRREGLIDGCIYYLEFLAEKDQRQSDAVFDSWTQKAKFEKKFQAKDVEEGPYGYNTYHPVWSVVGDPNNPTLYIPRLVQYIRCFKDRKLRLDLNEYSLIFFNVFHSIPSIDVTPKLLRLVNLLQAEVQKPLLNGFELRTFIEQNGFKDAKTLLAQFNKLGMKVTNVFERSNFGLHHIILQFFSPYHYKISFKDIVFTQNFLTGGRNFIQEICMNLPIDADWKVLMQKVHPDSQIYCETRFRTRHQPFLTLFDLVSQDWKIPWDTITKDWAKLLDEKKDNTPTEPDFGFIMPDEEILAICALLEVNPLVLNSELSSRTKMPLEKVRTIRKTLEEETLAYRTLFLFHRDLCEYCIIDVPGNESWKYRILEKIGETFPNYYISLLENLRTSGKALRFGGVQRPTHTNSFVKLFQETFKDAFKYRIRRLYFRPNLMLPFQTTFNAKTGTWDCDLENYIISPMPFITTKPQRGMKP